MKTTHTPRSLLARGFTLLEIMVVLLIIGLLLAVVAGGINGFREGAEIQTTDAKVQSLVAQLTQYKSLGGQYPTQGQGIDSLHRRPGDPQPKRWVQAIKNEADLMDTWGTKFLYRYPGSHNPTSFDVYSAGPDKQPDTSDDIGNW